MCICIGIWFLLQQVKASFIKLVDFICCWSFPLSFLSGFGAVVASSWLWVVDRRSCSMDCEMSGWYEGDICCWSLKVGEPGDMVTLISRSDIARLAVVTLLVALSLRKFSLSKVTYHHIFQNFKTFGDDVNIATKKELT